MREVPIIRIPFSTEDKQSLLEGWTDVLESGFLTLGSHTERFEELFREFTGAEYAVSVSNGTSALEVIIRALEIEGKSIIVPTNTFLASALAVAHSGNKVVFADSDRETLSLDPEDVARSLEGLGEVVEGAKSPNGSAKVLLEFMGRLVQAKVPWDALQFAEEHPLEKARLPRRTRGRGRWTQSFKRRMAATS